MSTLPIRASERQDREGGAGQTHLLERLAWPGLAWRVEKRLPGVAVSPPAEGGRNGCALAIAALVALVAAIWEHQRPLCKCVYIYAFATAIDVKPKHVSNPFKHSRKMRMVANFFLMRGLSQIVALHLVGLRFVQ